MSSAQKVIVGLGEVLWDILPGGEQLGGAPANFAYMTSRLGDCGIIASRVGADLRGRKALDSLQLLGLATTYIQLDETHPTGTVHVAVDEAGQPDYTITEDVAWDHLSWTPQLEELAARADAVCFGSLAQRHSHSRETIKCFLRATRPAALRIFDVNLRQHFYSAEMLSAALDAATVIKLNHEELPRVAELLHLGGRGENAQAHRLVQVFDLEMVCVTRGARGSLLVTASDLIEHAGFEVAVADTVGAGDAFTAAFVHHYLRHTPLEKIIEAANRLGAFVASRTGAMPTIEQNLVDDITTGRMRN